MNLHYFHLHDNQYDYDDALEDDAPPFDNTDPERFVPEGEVR